MALPPLATVANLEDAMQVTAGSLDAAQAQLALRRASGRVRRFTRQDFTLVENETVELPGGERVLTLPKRPLVVDEDHPLTVVELQVFWTVEVALVEDTDYSRLGSELTRGYPWYQPTRYMGWPRDRTLGVWAPKVRVTYSHGLAEVPDDVLDVVLDLATLNLSNPELLRSVSIDDYSRTFASETIGGARLTREHKDDLRPYRRTTFSVAQS